MALISTNAISTLTVCIVLIAAGTGGLPAAEPDPDRTAAATSNPAPPAQLHPANACNLEAGPAMAVASVSDAETLRLTDGRELSLDVLTASLDDGTTIKSLETISANRSVLIYRTSPDGQKTDRYGRIKGQALVERSVNPPRSVWLQAELIGNGLARFKPGPASTSCAATLLRLEQQARNEQRGHWAGSTFQVLSADDPARIARFENRFAIVAGTVRRASKSKGRTYLNFGSDWRNDFTVLIPRRPKQTKGHATAGKKGAASKPPTVTRLPQKGDKLRIRGWVEMRGGPLIEINHPNQIEFLN